MTIPLQPIKPSSFILGGSSFYGHQQRLISVSANSERNNDIPIEMHIGSGSHRFMIDLTIEEAEAFGSTLVMAARLRREFDTKEERLARKVEAMETNRLRAFFADSDGALEVN